MLLLLFGTKQQQYLIMKRKCLHIVLYYSVNLCIGLTTLDQILGVINSIPFVV